MPASRRSLYSAIASVTHPPARHTSLQRQIGRRSHAPQGLYTPCLPAYDSAISPRILPPIFPALLHVPRTPPACLRAVSRSRSGMRAVLYARARALACPLRGPPGGCHGEPAPGRLTEGVPVRPPGPSSIVASLLRAPVTVAIAACAIVRVAMRMRVALIVALALSIVPSVVTVVAHSPLV